jgi:hypothetical protein
MSPFSKAHSVAWRDPFDQVGDFVDRVLSLDSLHDQINLLSRGQAWVARKVEQALALNRRRILPRS